MTVSVLLTKIRLMLRLPDPQANDGATLMERGRSWPGLSQGRWRGQAAVPQTQDPSGFLGAPPLRELHRVMVLENLGLDKPRSLRSFCGT